MISPKRRRELIPGELIPGPNTWRVRKQNLTVQNKDFSKWPNLTIQNIEGKNQLNLTVQNKDSKIDSKLKNKDLPRYSPRTHSPYIQCSKAIKSHRKQNKLKPDSRYWRQRRQKAYLRRRKNQNASYREKKTEAATLQTNTLLLSTVILPDNLVSSSHGLCKSCRHVSRKPVAGNKSSTWNTTAAIWKPRWKSVTYLMEPLLIRTGLESGHRQGKEEPRESCLQTDPKIFLLYFLPNYNTILIPI